MRFHLNEERRVLTSSTSVTRYSFEQRERRKREKKERDEKRGNNRSTTTIRKYLFIFAKRILESKEMQGCRVGAFVCIQCRVGSVECQCSPSVTSF